LQAGFSNPSMQHETIPANKNADKILEKLLVKIDQQQNNKARVITLQRKTIWWAAASVILAVAGLQIFNSVNNKAAASKAIASVKTIGSAPLKIVDNNTAANMELVLADGSTVTLYPKSAISYYEAFDAAERNISLTGKAFFKVAKDKTRPFTVYAKGFATTALGTQFTVSTLINNQVEVKLFEGKVVVRPANKNLLAMNDVYLSPGQLFKVDMSTKSFAVAAFPGTNANASDISQSKQPQRKTTINNVSLQFNNESLSTVFEKLSEKYNTPINYSKNEMDSLYFTGVILRSDSLKNMLAIIANMNGLKYQELEGKIFIKK
jgi:transmembrane sensor